MKKILNYYHTLKYIPVARHIQRVLNRSRLLAYKKYPLLFSGYIRDRSKKKYPQGLHLKTLENSSSILSDTLCLLEANLSNVIKYDEMCFDVFLLNKKKTIKYSEASSLDLSEGSNQLWKMNLSYMGYISRSMLKGDHRAFHAMGRLLETYKAESAWRQNDCFRSVWHPYSVSHRLINTVISLHEYIKISSKQEEDFNSILDEVKFMACFIELNLETELQYNHLTKNYLALSVFKELMGIKIDSRFEKKVIKAIEYQVLNDGGHAERSPMYHSLFISDLKVFKACSFSKDFFERIGCILEKMENAAQLMSHNDGNIALFGDSWFGECIPPSNFRLKEVASYGVLEETGYAKLGSDNCSVVFNCGNAGPDDNPGHAHSDFLAFELQLENKRVIVDKGVPTYSKGSLRDISKSAAAHNGPRFEGTEPLEFWDSFRVARRSSVNILHKVFNTKNQEIVASCCIYGNRGVVTRGIKCKSSGSLIIRDLWENGNDRPVTNFLLNIDHVDIIRSGNVHSIVLADGWSVSIVADTVTVSDDCYYDYFGMENKCLNLRVEALCDGSRVFSEMEFSYK